MPVLEEEEGEVSLCPSGGGVVVDGGGWGWRLSHLLVTDIAEEESQQSTTSRRSTGGGHGGRRDSSSDNLFELLPHVQLTPEEGSGCGGGGYRVLCAAGTAEGTTPPLGIVLNNQLIELDLEEEGEEGEKKGRPHPPRTLTFPAPIDFILWRRSIILVGLSNSELVLIHPPTFQIKESRRVGGREVDGSVRFFVEAAIHSNPDPQKIDVIAVGVSGTVYSFNNISLSDGTLDSTHDQNTSVDIDVGSVRGTRVSVLQKPHPQVVAASAPSRNVVILGEADGSLCMEDVGLSGGGVRKELKLSQNVNILQDLGYGETSGVTITKIVHFEGLIFTLLSNGRLEMLLDFMLMPTGYLRLPEEDYIVHDFSVMMNSEGDVKLWALYGPQDMSGGGYNYVGIFGTPSFTIEFSLKIPKLVANSEDNRRRLMFPSQVTPFEEPSAFLELSPSTGQTTIYRMLETSTDSTIQKLITRGKFGPAAALSIKYGKDLDVVYKAKVRAQFNTLCGLPDNEAQRELFGQLIETLEGIKDAGFVCGFCAQRGWPQIAWIRKLLSIGKARVTECSGTAVGKTLLLTIKKFFTFEQVFPRDASLQDWLAFVSEENTMFQQCMWFVNKQEFSRCEKVWRRHYDEFIPSLKLDNFGPFFLILFSQKLKSVDAVSLFKCILPSAIDKCAEAATVTTTDVPHEGQPQDVSQAPNASNFSTLSFMGDNNKEVVLTDVQLGKVEILLDIVKRQVCSLEREKAWPTEALAFSKVVISIVKEVAEGLNSSRRRNEQNIRTQNLICSQILEKMESVVQNLVELADLKKHHSIRIPFQQYIQDDVIIVVNSMLFELFHRQEIETFITNFLTPFAQRKGIELDNLFSEHVKTVVSDLPFHINPMDIPQEERLICLVSRISGVESKLRSILCIAEEWPVPWSPNIDALVLSCLQNGKQNANKSAVMGELLNKIDIMRVQVPFRCLLHKYRLTATKVQNYCGVVMALRRIITVGKPEYYEDCLEFIKHTGRVDEVKLRALEFSLKLRSEAPIETLVNASWDRGLLKMLLVRTIQEFKGGNLHIYSEEEIGRITEVGKTLANILDDRKAIEFFKLRELIPSLTDPDIVYDVKYPYLLLNYIMPDSGKKSASQLISLCTSICTITFTPLANFLVAASAYFIRTGTTSPEIAKLWEFIQKVVSSPGHGLSTFAQAPAMNLAQFLLLQAPEATEEQLALLADFLALLTSFDDELIGLTKMMGGLRIFSALREQEIPQEKEFKQIYAWMYVEGIPYGPGDPFFSALKGFGSTILKFGDKNLFLQAFRWILKEFCGRIVGTGDPNPNTLNFIKRIKEVHKELYRAYESIAVPETDQEVLQLVESLKEEADIHLTPYALRQRNKSRFLAKLLKTSHFSLASQVAIVFQVYEDTVSWSEILKGFMVKGDVGELKKVLLELRNVSELWILKEFADGWKMVAQSDQGFLDICPIPLD